MHILLIPAWYKSSSNPLAGIFFEEQARALQKRGHKIGVLVPSFLPYNSLENNTCLAYNDKGIFTINQQVKAISKRSNTLNRAYFLYRVYHKAYKDYVKQNGKPNLIHSHVYKFSGLLAAYIKKKQQIPHVFTAHFSIWVHPDSRISPSDVKVLNTVLKGSDKAFAVSNFLRNALIEKTELAKTVVVLPNMLNDIFFENTKKVSKSKTFRFINVGNLVSVKQQLLLLRAFSRFMKTYKVDAELCVLGEGPLRIQLEAEIKKLGLVKNCKLMGAMGREELKYEIQKSHVGVISSIVETFSIAGIEFMSQGLPVIATNCGGPNEYMRDFNGKIVHNEEEMAVSFYSVYKNYSSYDADKIARYIQTSFSEAVIVQKLERTYQELVQ